LTSPTVSVNTHAPTCAILVWLRLKDLAYKSSQTIYQIKHGLLSNYLVQQLKRPDVPMFVL